MPRPDGRIEKGQRLGSAISARAWNRAQDAADVVLGVRPGFGASVGDGLPSRLVYPVQVAGGTAFTHAVVSVSTLTPATNLNTQEQTPPYTSAPHLPNSAIPSFLNGQIGGGSVWCVCEHKLNGAAPVGYCVFRGVTFARIRVRSQDHRFATPSVSWEGDQLYAEIPGTLDTTQCECAGAARILSIGGGGVGKVYWAMILI